MITHLPIINNPLASASYRGSGDYQCCGTTAYDVKGARLTDANAPFLSNAFSSKCSSSGTTLDATRNSATHSSRSCKQRNDDARVSSSSTKVQPSNLSNHKSRNYRNVPKCILATSIFQLLWHVHPVLSPPRNGARDKISGLRKALPRR